MKNKLIISAIFGLMLFMSAAHAQDSHELRIVSISAPESVDAGSQFYVTAAIKNRGDVREDFIGIAVLFDKKLYTSPSFSLEPGEIAEKSFSLSAPDSAGRYAIEVQLANAYNSHKQGAEIKVSSLFLSLATSKSSATAGEWVGISGYATRDGFKSAGAVSLYRDGLYVGTVIPTENGYYSTQIKLDSEGNHRITAIIGDIKKEQYIYVYPRTDYAPLPPPVQPVMAPNYTAVIIVAPDGQRIVYPNIAVPQARGKYEGFSFVNVEVNAKEVDAIQYGGNTLTVTISNHLGRSGLFGINTDFNDKWVFLPKQDVLEDGESKNFDIYFSADETGRFVGNLYVYESTNLVKKVPVSLFVSAAGATEKAPLISANAIKEVQDSAGIFVAVAALIALAYVVLRKPMALEPLMLAPMFIKDAIGGTKTEAKAEESDFQSRLEKRLSQLRTLQSGKGADFFQVPKKNIII